MAAKLAAIRQPVKPLCDIRSLARGSGGPKVLVGKRRNIVSSRPRTRALYNGDCPVCSAEMCRYEAVAQSKDLPIGFEDLTRIDLADWGVSEDQATRLLHVVHDGKLYVGFEAMCILWAQIPHMRWLARLCRLPVVFPVLDRIYEHGVARVIYNRHLRRKARGLTPARRGAK